MSGSAITSAASCAACEQAGCSNTPHHQEDEPLQVALPIEHSGIPGYLIPSEFYPQAQAHKLYLTKKAFTVDLTWNVGLHKSN